MEILKIAEHIVLQNGQSVVRQMPKNYTSDIKGEHNM